MATQQCFSLEQSFSIAWAAAAHAMVPPIQQNCEIFDFFHNFHNFHNLDEIVEIVESSPNCGNLKAGEPDRQYLWMERCCYSELVFWEAAGTLKAALIDCTGRPCEITNIFHNFHNFTNFHEIVEIVEILSRIFNCGSKMKTGPRNPDTCSILLNYVLRRRCDGTQNGLGNKSIAYFKNLLIFHNFHNFCDVEIVEIVENKLQLWTRPAEVASGRKRVLEASGELSSGLSECSPGAHGGLAGVVGCFLKPRAFSHNFHNFHNLHNFMKLWKLWISISRSQL